LAAGLKPKGGFLNLAQWIEGHAPALPFGPLNLTQRVQAYAEEAATRLAQYLGVVAGATLDGALTLFFTVMTAFFVLRHWPEILTRAERMLPLHPKHSATGLPVFQRLHCWQR
jgi:predicted PurR-regulated permease PerM